MRYTLNDEVLRAVMDDVGEQWGNLQRVRRRFTVNFVWNV